MAMTKKKPKNNPNYKPRKAAGRSRLEDAKLAAEEYAADLRKIVKKLKERLPNAK
jgi:hypothetical protein